MMKRSFSPNPWLLAAAGFALAPSAFAAECADDADCGQGYSCEVVGVSGCAAPACAAGEDCPDVECDTQEFRECVPGACESDNDCADSMICETYEVGGGCTDFAVAPCEDGADCKPPPEPVCDEPTTESRCVERYNAACSEAADCGDGFECTKHEICQCSGSSGSSGSGAGVDPVQPTPTDSGGSDDEVGQGGAASTEETGTGGGDSAAPARPPAEDPDAVPPERPSEEACSCYVPDEGYCELQRVECEDNSACPADWTCSVSAGDTSSTNTDEPATSPPPAPDQGSAFAPVPPEMDGGAAEEDRATEEDRAAEGDTDAEVEDSTEVVEKPDVETAPDGPVTGYCVPPNYRGDSDSGAVAQGEGTGTSASDTAGSPNGNADPGSNDLEGDATEPPSKDDTTAVDEDGNTDEEVVADDPSGGDSEAGAGEKDDTDDAEDDSDGQNKNAVTSSKDDGGCSVVAPGTSSTPAGAWLLGLFGLAFLRRRKS